MSSTSRTAAAAVAGQIRADREHVVAEIRAGRSTLDASTAGVEIDQVKVVVLAESVPGVGKVRARSILDSLGIEHAARWGELGDRKGALAESLRAARGGDA